MARIFLSHASSDTPTVWRIATALRDAGHDTWLDEEEVLVGESIPAAVERGLRNADFVVLCLSRAAAARGWIEAERDATLMQQFSDRKERVLPVRLEEVAPPYLVASLAYVDLFPDTPAFVRGIDRLMRSIVAHQARHAGTAPSEQPTSLSSMPPSPTSRAVPVYLNAEVEALSKRLENARARKRRLHEAGIKTDDLDREILELRRQLREGGQLRAGDALSDGRYLLVETIGHGGFATVWEAYDCENHIRVAVKVLHSNLSGDPLRRERFFRGAHVMMNLVHPAVVRVLDPKGDDGGFCYFVMEFVPGGNLRDAVLGKRVDYHHRIALILQIGEALMTAHASRLIHRDVKPQNILLDEKGNAKLTDFDLVAAGDTTGGTRTGALGTFLYAAPECLEKPQEATARADVFGLGMTAIFCLSGKDLRPATFGNPALTIARLDCSLDVQKVLEQAVKWEPELRYADAAAMLDALRAALNTPTQTALMSDRQVTEQPEFETSAKPDKASSDVHEGLSNAAGISRDDKLLAVSESRESQEFSALRRERDFYCALARFSEHETLETLLDAALAALVKHVSAREALIEVIDDGVEPATHVAAHGCEGERVTAISSFVSRGIIGEAMATGKTVVTANAAKDPRFDQFISVQDHHIEAVLCVPIGETTHIGVVYLQGKQGAVGFEAYDSGAQREVELLARALAGPIERLLSRGEIRAARARRRTRDLDDPFAAIRGKSQAMEAVVERLRQVATLDVHVLLTGPSGAGKTMLANAVHLASRRRSGPFVQINCAAIPEQLLENELFGTEPGARSAVTRGTLKGKVEAAEAGTLFLDEIAELSLGAQAKLLQMLQNNTYYRVGGTQPRRADVCIIAATNVNLKAAVAECKFRDDLYHRLEVIEVRVPSLAERSEDLIPLSYELLHQVVERHQFAPKALSPSAIRAIQTAQWPGNVRQLANHIESAAIRAQMRGSDAVEGHDMFSDEPQPSGATETLQSATRRFQRDHILGALAATDWSVLEAARVLDVSRSQMYNLIRAFELKRE